MTATTNPPPPSANALSFASIVPSIAAYTHIGCYQETANDTAANDVRALAGGTMHLNDRRDNSKYAGLESGKEPRNLLRAKEKMASKLANTSAPASSPWKVYTLESTGKKYWYNKDTKQKSWTDPTAPTTSTAKDPTSKPAATAALKSATPSKDPAASQPWKEYEASGKKYWYNKETKQKSWTNPNAPAKPPAKELAPKSTAAVSSATPVSGKETTAKPSTSNAQDIAATTVAGSSKDAKAPAPKSATAAAAPIAKTAAPDNKSAPAPTAHSETKTAVSGSPHPPIAFSTASAHPPTPAPVVESSHQISGVASGHGSEHATVEVKSKKKNWLGALDAGRKVLDSAIEKAKKGDYLEKLAGHDTPVVKGPVAGGAHHDAPAHATKATHKEAAQTAPAETHKAAPADHPAAKAPDHAPTPVAQEARPKAPSKLSWKSPFKKRAASPPPPANEGTSSSINDEKGVGSAPAAPATAQTASSTKPAPIAASAPTAQTTSSTKPTPAAASAPTAQTTSSTIPTPAAASASTAPGQSASKGLASSYYDGTDYDDGGPSYANFVSSGTPAGGAAPSQQNSQVGQDAAAAGVGAVGGAVAGAAGTMAYNDYEEGQGSSPPSAPPEEDGSAPPSPPPELGIDVESGPSSPPPELDLDNGSAPGSPPNGSPPPSLPADDGDDDAGYTTYAFGQPPSPPAGYSGPPSPPAESDPGNDQGPPSPAQSASPPAPASSAFAPQPDDDDDNQPPASPAYSASPLPPASPSPPASLAPEPDYDTGDY
ncbi:hypothetical protein OEA41_002252 [Lepraria neglecta]|uniref:WW domain-containing protein n=1 Tax=Lepraria neglecta TaxID=209136 RepID=A0AAE0DM88_9LECA|nr:hypothetical protein OEA41_002252 [Lepraria neglecta]